LKTLNGIELLRAGKPSEAAAELRQAVEAKPDYPEGQYYLGIALAQSGHNDEAVAAFQAALARRSQSAEIRYNFGIALWQMGRTADAIMQFRQATDIDPRHGLAFCALGKALRSANQPAESASALKRARDLGACE
jgi:Tfp pilus assembly protein PilF